PIMVPEEPYEVHGDMPNVVFPEGAVVIRDELFLFYGGADKVCCVASVGLYELVDYVLSNT
ncbi:MAG: glycosidase, partial [Thermotogae bacterium]|nr:glycosidase [Thermotogota bacterium]